MATESLAEYVHRQLTDLSGLSLENALTIVNYVLTQKTEVNIADLFPFIKDINIEAIIIKT